jgi:hypothetical protein
MVMDSSKQDSVCIRRKTPPLFLFCLLVIALTTSNAQITNERSDIVQLQSVLAKSTQFVVDTTVIGLRKHVETLASSASRAANDAKRRLAVLTDSLIVSAKDTLDASRQDSLRVLGKSFELQFASHESSTIHGFQIFAPPARPSESKRGILCVQRL